MMKSPLYKWSFSISSPQLLTDVLVFKKSSYHNFSPHLPHILPNFLSAWYSNMGICHLKTVYTYNSIHISLYSVLSTVIHPTAYTTIKPMLCFIPFTFLLHRASTFFGNSVLCKSPSPRQPAALEPTANTSSLLVTTIASLPKLPGNKKLETYSQEQNFGCPSFS